MKTLKTPVMFFSLLLLGACATAAQILYPVSDDPLKTKPGIYTLDPSHTSIIFSVKHMGFSYYRGRFNEAEGSLELDPTKPENSKLFVRIKTASIDTGNDVLYEELTGKQLLNMDLHPYISFESNKVSILTEKTARIDGALILAGVKQPFSFTANFVGSGVNPLSGKQTIGFNGEGSLKRSEYGLTEWLPFVGDDITITLDAEFTRNKS